MIHWATFYVRREKRPHVHAEGPAFATQTRRCISRLSVKGAAATISAANNTYPGADVFVPGLCKR